VSHFSTLKVKLQDEKLAGKVAEQMGFTWSREAEYVNRFDSRERLTDCMVYRDAQGRVKLVVDKQGNVIHEQLIMGREAFQFLCQYSEAFIRRMAEAEGATVVDCGVDKTGAQVLEICYV